MEQEHDILFDRYFTPAEASRTLPLVRRIVQDILECGSHARTLYAQTECAPDDPELVALAQTLTGYFDELRELGCEYKDWDFSVGLVDFPSVIDGEPVLLCWRSDEPALRYYHGIHEGYRGRKEIPSELLI